MELFMHSITSYIERVCIALSVLFNVLLGGYSNQSFSARNYQWKRENKPNLVPVIDLMFRVGLKQTDHCLVCWTYWYIRKYKEEEMITIYGKPSCVWCDRAKRLADTFELSYEYKDVSDKSILEELKTKKPDIKTVPQIWWHDNHIGGYEQFAEEIENTLGGNYGQGKS